MRSPWISLHLPVPFGSLNGNMNTRVVSFFLSLIFGAALASAQTNFFWTNTVSASWSAAVWTNDPGTSAPVAGGSNNYTIVFQPNATYVASLNRGTPNFLLNQLIFNAGTVTIRGTAATNLVFISNSGGGLPQFIQNSAGPVYIATGVILSNNTTFAGTGTGAVILSNTVSSVGALTKNTLGVLNLVASNSYAGGTLVNTGILAIGNAFALGTGLLTMQDGTVLSNTVTLGTLPGVINTINLASGSVTMSVASGTTLWLGGPITNVGSLVKIGAGTLNLSNNNTYGNTVVLDGFLRQSTTASLSSSNLVLNGGVLELAAGNFTRSLGATGNQVQVYGNSGFSAYTTDRTVNIGNAGSNLVWGSTYFNPTVFVLNGAGANRVVFLANGIDLNGADRAINANAGTISVISGNITNTTGTAGLIKGGVGVLRLDGINTYNGSTIVTGGALRIANNTLLTFALPSGNLVLSNGVIEINYGAPNNVFTRAVGTGSDQVSLPGGISGFSAISAPRRVNLGGSGDILYWGSANFAPSGLVLNTALAGALLTFENALDLNGGQRQINVEAIVAQITGDIINPSAPPSGITKAGAGTLRVVGANYMYDGTTIVSAGNLQLGDYVLNTGTLPGVISNAATVYFANPVAQTITNVLTGTGNYVKVGPGDLTLIGDNKMFNGTLSPYNSNLILDYSDAIAPTTGIGGSFAQLTLQGGTLTVRGDTDASITNIQVFRAWNLNAGAANIVLDGSGGSFVALTLSNLASRAAGGVVDFNVIGSGSIIYSQAFNFGIVGGYATWNKADWASTNNGVLVPFTGYTSPSSGVILDGSNTHVRIGGNVSITGPSTALNTLSGTNDGAAYTVTVGAGNTLRLGAVGGLLNPTGAGTLTVGYVRNDGKLTAGFTNNVAGELWLLNYSTDPLIINSGLTNNGTGALTVTIGGTGPVVLNGNNAFRGALYINGGSAVTISAGSTNILQTSGLNLARGSLTVNGVLFSGALNDLIGYNDGGNAAMTLAGSAIYQRTNADGAAYLAIAYNPGNVGTLNIQDSALFSNRFRTYIGHAGTGIVNQTGGTYLNIENTYLGNQGFRIGYWDIARGAAGVGKYFLNSGAFTNIGALVVGNSGFGAFFQMGGTAVVGGDFNIGSGYDSYGYYELSGGSLLNSNVVRLGSSGMGVLHMFGGSQTIVTGNGLRLGEGIAPVSVFYATGGVLTNVGPIVLSFSAGAGRAEFTIDDNASVIMTNSYLRMNNASGISAVSPAMTTNTLNLNGGLLQLNAINRGTNGGMSVINFNGGTLRANTGTTAFMAGLDGAYLYSGGATIDSGTNAIVIGQALLAPTGSGVTNIPWSGNISGYIGAPYVLLSGGSGTGATAVALFDRTSGNVTGIVITSRGSGYGAGDTVNATLVGGGNANYDLGTVTLGANTSGGLTKLGTGMLTLMGTNTYTGSTVVEAGILDLFFTIPNPAGIAVSNGAAVVLGIGGPGQWSSDDATNVTSILTAGASFGLDTTLTNFNFSYNLTGFTDFYKLGSNTLIVSGTSGYTGNTYVMGGGLRAEWGAGLPSTSNLILTGGVWETSSGIASNWGTGARQFQLTGGTSGFSAVNSPLTVNLGGNGQTIVWGTNIFNPAALILNNLSANTNIVFVNKLDVAGGVRSIGVLADTAYLSGAILNSVVASNAGGLIKFGSGTLVISNPANAILLGNPGLQINGGTVVLADGTLYSQGTFGSTYGAYGWAYGNNSDYIARNAGETGTLTLMNGARFIRNNAYLYLGAAAGARGVLNVQDNAVFWGNYRLSAGENNMGTGIVNLSSGTIYLGNDLILGNNGSLSVGIVNQTGGVMSNAGGWVYIGNNGIGAYYLRAGANVVAGETRLGQSAGSYGYFEQSGGTRLAAAWLRNLAGVGVWYQLGGTNIITGNGVILGETSGTGVAYFVSGVYSSSLPFYIGYNNSPGTARAEATIDGNANVLVANIFVLNRAGGVGSNSTAILNLNGGTLTVNTLYKGGPNASSGYSVLNLDGGTLRANANNVVLLGGTNSASLLDAAYVWSGGAIIDTYTNNVTISQSLIKPDGYGVTNVSFGVGVLSNYVGAPYVGLSGGTGTGATAVALFDSVTGIVTGIVVTSRGTGYGSGDILTATVVGGGNTNVSFSVQLGDNTGIGGGLTKVGSGNLILSNANTYLGDTIINGGLLRFYDTNAIPSTTTIYLNSGGAVALGVTNLNANLLPRLAPGAAGMIALLASNATENFNFTTWTNLVLGAGENLTYGGTYTPFTAAGTNFFRLGAAMGATFTYTGLIADTSVSVLEINNGGLPGTVVLVSTNTYTGTTTLNGGLLSVANFADSNGNVPTNGLLIFNGGGIQYTGTDSVTTVRNMTNPGGANFDITASNAILTINSDVAGAGGFTKAGLGTLTFGVVQNFQGGLTVNNGFLQLASGDNPISTNNAITVNGGTLDIGGGTQTTTNLVTFRGGLTQNGAINSLNYNYDGQAGTAAVVLAGPVGLNKTTAGLLVLLATNTYSGSTFLNGGTLAVSSLADVGGTITTNGLLVFNGGSLRYMGAGDITARIITNIGGATFDVTNSAANLIIPTTIGGAGSLSKSGPGALLFSNVQTYTGGTIVNAGTLGLAAGNNMLFSNGYIAVNGGVLNLFGSTQTVYNVITFNGGQTTNGVVISTLFDFDARAGTAAVQLTGPVNLLKTTTGTFVLTTSNNYTGTTFLNAGTLSISDRNALNYGLSEVVNRGVLQIITGSVGWVNNPMVMIGGGISTPAGSAGAGWSGSLELRIGTNTFSINSGGTNTPDFTVNTILFGAGALQKTGAGSMLLSNVSTYTGATIIGGGTLILPGVNDPLFTNSFINVNGGILNLSGGTQTTYNVVQFNSGITTNGFINSANFNFDGQGGTIYASLIGTNNLVKGGTGTLSMMNTNYYTGNTIVTGGTLRVAIASSNPYGLNGNNLMLSNGVLELNIVADANQTFNRALGAGSNQILVTGVSGFGVIAGAGVPTSINGARTMTITLNAAGSVVTWGTNFFNPSVLVFSANGRQLFFNNVLDLNGAHRAISTLSGVGGSLSYMSLNVTNTTGTAGLIKGGPGVLQLYGINTYNGPTVITGGVLRIGNATINSLALPSGNLILSNGVLEINHGYANSVFTRDVGTGLNQVYFGPLTTGGFSAVTAPRTINLGGAGAMLVWGSANFSPGALVLNEATRDGNPLLTFVNGIDLKGTNRQVNVNANSAQITGIITNSTGTAGLTKAGGGVLRVVGANYLYNGTTIVAAGVLQLGDFQYNTGVLPVVSVISNAGNVYFANPIAQTITNILTGTGNFFKLANADLTLVGSNSTFNGTLSPFNGNLILDYSAAAASARDLGGFFSTLTIQGGTLTVRGSASGSVTNSQLFRSWTLNVGASRIVVDGTAGSYVALTLSNVTRAASNGGVVDFSVLGNGAIISTQAAVFGTLGGYATWDKADWVTTNNQNKLVAFTGYTFPTAGQILDASNTHVRIDGNVSLGANVFDDPAIAINTLSGTNNGVAYTVTLGGGTLRLGALGGLLNPAGAGALTIGASPNDGILTAGLNTNLAGELILLNYSTAPLIINSSMTNNERGNVTVTIGGTGPVTLNGNNSFGGVFYINGGSAVTISDSSTNQLLFNSLQLQRGSLMISGALYSSSADNVGLNYGDVGTLTLAGSGLMQRTNSGANFILGNQIHSVGVLNIQDNAFFSNRYRTYLGNWGTGIVNQTGGAYFTGDNTYIGNTGTKMNSPAAPNAIGRYFLFNGGFTNLNTLLVGVNGVGGFYQTNGASFIGNDIQIGAGFDSSGYYELSGGSVMNAGYIQVGVQGIGVFYQFGGNNVITNEGILFGNGFGGVGVAYVTGGTINLTNSQIVLGWSAGASRNEFTIAGNAAVIVTNNVLRMNYNQNANVMNPTITTNTLNLNGGLLQVNAIFQAVSGGGTSGVSVINFNGGTLAANNSTIAFIGAMDGAYMYSGGAFIDGGTNTIVIQERLLAPTGSGITNIPWSGSIGGYVGAPYVQLSGGSGTGATAVALYDYVSSTVTGIVITSRGSGYGAGDTVTVSLLGGGNTNVPLGAASLGSNAGISGGLTKLGTGTLALSNDNTYLGATIVNDGTLQVGFGGPAGTLLSTNVNLVAGTSVLAFNRLGVSTNASTIIGSGSLIQKGLGVIYLTGTNTYSGGTTLAGGVLAFDSTNVIPALNSITLNGGGIALNSDNFLATIAPYLINLTNGTGMLALLPTNATENMDFSVATGGGFTNLVLGAAANLTYGGVYTPYSQDGTNYFRIGAPDGVTFTYTNVIADYSVSVLEINKGFAGVVALGGTNTFSGYVQLNNGTLSVANLASTGSPIPTNSLVIFNGGALRYTGAGDTGSMNITNIGVAVFDITSPAANLILGGVMAGTNGFSKRGPGSLTLAGLTIITNGLVNIYDGTVNMTGSNVWLGTNTRDAWYVRSNTTLNLSGYFYNNGRLWIGDTPGFTAVVNQTDGTVVLGSDYSLLMGSATGAGAIYNLYGGTLSNMSRITMALGTGAYTLFNMTNGNLYVGTYLEIGRGPSNPGGVSSTNWFVQSGGTAMVNQLYFGQANADRSNQFSNLIISNGVFNVNTFSTLALGTGNVSRIYIGRNANVGLPAFPTQTVALSFADIIFDGGTLSTRTTVLSSNFFGRIDAAYIGSNGANFVVGLGTNVAILHNLQNLPGQVGVLRKSGDGFLALSNATYTGGTIINGGVLYFLTTNAIAPMVTVNTNATAAFEFPGVEAVVAATVVKSSGGTIALTPTNANENISFKALNMPNAFLGAVSVSNLVYGGVHTPYSMTYRLGGGIGGFIYANLIGGSSNVLIGGGPASTVIFPVDQPYSGGTIVNNGTLQLGLGGTTGSITDTNLPLTGANAWIAFNRSGVITNWMTVTGLGGLVQMGPGTLVITNENSYGGPTVFAGGTLSFSTIDETGPNAIGTGNLVFNNGVLRYTGVGETTSRSITNIGLATFDITDPSAAIVLNGTVAGAGILKLGSGALVFSNDAVSVAGVTNRQGTMIFMDAALTNRTAPIYAGDVSGSNARLIFQGATIVTNTSELRLGVLAGSRGMMTISNGVSYTGNSWLQVGMAGTGVFYMAGGAVNITGSGLLTGNGAGGIGAIYQTGGDLFNSADLMVAYAAGGYGYHLVSGGTVTETNWTRVARQGLGIMHQTGGALTNTSGTLGLLIGDAASATGVLYQAGGTMNLGQLRLVQTTGARAELNLYGGTMTINSNLVFNQAAGTNIVNLIGGVLDVAQITRNSGGGLAYFNFDGGTLRATAATNATVFMGQGTKLTGAYLYQGGLNIDTGSKLLSIEQNLLAPPGSGVTNINFSGPLTGYLGAPYVAISGGNGTGATAVALFDYTSGSVTGILVTSRGFNYTSAPTVSLRGGGNTNYALTASIGANVSGGLTKSGDGTLLLNNVNTFTGPTIVQSGTLAISATAVITNTVRFELYSGTVLDVQAAGLTLAPQQTLKGSGTVLMSGGGSLSFAQGGTLSPGNSIGTLTVDGYLYLGDNSAGHGMLNFELSTTNNSDRVNVTSWVDFTDMATNWFVFSSVGNLEVGDYVLIHSDTGLGLSYLMVDGTNFTSIAGNGSYQGYLWLREPDPIGNPGVYDRVMLTVVPEPGTGTLVGTGLLMLWFVRRRRYSRA